MCVNGWDSCRRLSVSYSSDIFLCKVRLTQSFHGSYPMYCPEFDANETYSTVKPYAQQAWKTISVSPNLHGGMGLHFWSHGSRSKLWWTCGLPIHAGLCRSRLFRTASPPFQLIQLTVPSLVVCNICQLGTPEKNWCSGPWCFIPARCSLAHSPV
jgi:hypothetical protein